MSGPLIRRLVELAALTPDSIPAAAIYPNVRPRFAPTGRFALESVSLFVGPT